MSKRLLKVNALIREEVAKIILREIECPEDVLITVTRVETTPNLAESTVFVSVMPEQKEEKILGILEKNVYFLQQKINERLRMRPIPRIGFRGEEKTKEAARIEKILERLKKEKN